MMLSVPFDPKRAQAWILLVWLALSLPVSGALSWTEASGHRYADLNPDSSGQPGFTLLSPDQTGVTFTNELRGDAYLTNAVAHNGAGLAIGDVNGDGLPDIYLCGLDNPNRLYLNLGNWQFKDQPLGIAACENQYSTGATLADVDGDRDLDLLVNSIGKGTRLFLNDGNAHWTEMANSGLSTNASSTSIALADIDGDGDLDLYCTHFIDVMHLADPTTRFAVARKGDRWEVTKINGESTRLPHWKDRFEALADGKVRELPEYHALYRNDGKGHFTPILFEPGIFSDEQGNPIPPFRDWGLAAMFRDINGDGIPDLYVCNDNTSPDRIWINSGKGTFRALETTKLRHTSRSSMGVDFADLDRDGLDDFIVVDMLSSTHARRMTQLVRDRPNPLDAEKSDERPQYNRNTLYFGNRDGFFVEAAFMAGVAATDWTWTPIFIDVDLDGYEDLLVTNGFEFDVMDQDSSSEIKDPQRRKNPAELKRSMQLHPRFRSPNIAFRNQHNGTFKPASQEWGFDLAAVSYGMAQGDLDNDGDLDLVVNNLNLATSIYRNHGPGKRIQVRLKGLPGNTLGIGAKIRLIGGSLTQAQEMISGGRYLSGDQANRVFAADPDSQSPMRLEIAWRTGAKSSISNVIANRIYEIDEPTLASPPAPPSPTTPPASSPLFTDVSSLLNFSHSETPLDDWATQATLPHRLSKLGPGIAWFDLDQDGWDDLIIPGGRGTPPTLFHNDQGQSFSKQSLPPSANQTTAQSAALGWHDGQGTRFILAAEFPADPTSASESEIVLLSPQNPAANSHTKSGNAHPGPIAMADVDGDGDLDVFVGGRYRTGRFPEPVSSTLWINSNGKLAPDNLASSPFKDLGMVSGACFADFNADGTPDLALAMPWGPVRIFLNQKGSFHDATSTYGLASLTGWWTSVVAGDFNGDGQIDLAAGNWGRNTVYELYQPSIFRLFYGDWSGDGIIQIIEAWQSGDKWLPVHDRTWLSRGFPSVAEQFTSHQAFAQASVRDILGPRFDSSTFVEATELQSMIFLNRGNRFEPRALPREAQLAPVFSVNVGDADGDGFEDLFLSQNFFGTASDITRDDAGKGLWLHGQGDGSFKALDSVATGLRIEGEQRGAALVDFNQDGRVDLAVTQNSGPTKLYVNRNAKPGVLVSLKGPRENPDAVGAKLRVVYPNGRMGPIRTVQAGSGYSSQDSARQVLGFQEKPTGVWIQWPSLKTQSAPIPDSSTILRVDFTP